MRKEKYIAPTTTADLIITDEHVLQIGGSGPDTPGEVGPGGDFARQQTGDDGGFKDGTFDFGSWDD